MVVDSLLGLVLMYLVASSNVSSYFWPYLHALIERLDMVALTPEKCIFIIILAD